MTLPPDVATFVGSSVAMGGGVLAIASPTELTAYAALTTAVVGAVGMVVGIVTKVKDRRDHIKKDAAEVREVARLRVQVDYMSAEIKRLGLIISEDKAKDHGGK